MIVEGKTDILGDSSAEFRHIVAQAEASHTELMPFDSFKCVQMTFEQSRGSLAGSDSEDS